MSELLLLFAFVWMGVSALLGLFLGIRHVGVAERLDALAQAGRLSEYHREHTAFRWTVTVHAHGFLFSVVCALIALILPRLSLPAMAIDVLVPGLIAASVVWTASALARIRPLMGLADFAFLGAVLTTALGLARAFQ